MTTRDTLTKRAQAMCNADGRTRYVKWTSMGWRIELEPSNNYIHEELPCYQIDPVDKAT